MSGAFLESMLNYKKSQLQTRASVRVDRCVEISRFIESGASSRLYQGILEEGQDWREAGSVRLRYRTIGFWRFYRAVLKLLEEQETEQLQMQHLKAEAKEQITGEVVKHCLERDAWKVKLRIQSKEEEGQMKANLEEEHATLHKTGGKQEKENWS